VRLHDLLHDLPVTEVVPAGAAPEVLDVVMDSRTAGPGAIFACVPGRSFDGHDFADAAVAQGAAALLVERILPLDVPQVRVASVRAVLGPLAAAVHGHPSRSLAVVGITGTNGKTTTTWLLRAIAEAAGRRCAVVGTFGVVDGSGIRPTGFTTPEAPDLARLLAAQRGAGTEMVVMEVSSHALAERRVDGTRFATTCFTNLAPEHLDLHGTLDEYFAAKARLFTPTFTGRAAVNVADPFGADLAARAVADGLTVTSFAAAPADRAVAVSAVGAVATGSGSVFTLVVDGVRSPVRLPLVGDFNIANAVAAAATARSLAMDVEAIRHGLASVEVVPGRFEVVGSDPVTVVVDYAHTPDGIAAVAGTARSLTDGRVVTVFGCGGDRDVSKRAAMGRAAGNGSDLVVLTSDNPRSEAPEAIAAEAAVGLDAAGAAYRIELDRRAAIRMAIDAARPGDIVLILGKGAETGQQIGETRHEFDDRSVAREELNAAWS
jgi:UDP-N-acetylmuramoyl-L-alanyl-D-glutamate--2,6-diaminopimelate ligase